VIFVDQPAEDRSSPDRHSQVDLWVPNTSSGSCCERVFVDDAADPVAAANSERVEIGNRCWERPERSGLGEGAVGPVGVVMALVRVEHV
jgi:hypothetical protein